MKKLSTEYQEEYIKSLMARMTEKELSELIALAESYYCPQDLASARSEAKEIIRIRNDMDARLAAYRNR